MHSALSCVLSPLPHALQNEESRNRRASETARARFLVCGTPWHFAIFLTLWLTDFANLRTRVYRVSYRYGSAPPHRTAPHCPHAFCLHPRLLDINYGTVRVYTLRVRLLATFDPSPSSPPQRPLYPPYRLVSDKHPIDKKWRDGLREST